MDVRQGSVTFRRNTNIATGNNVVTLLFSFLMIKNCVTEYFVNRDKSLRELKVNTKYKWWKKRSEKERGSEGETDH